MKKAVSMMLAAVLTASLLAGCGSSGSEPAAESGGGERKTAVKLPQAVLQAAAPWQKAAAPQMASMI